jgi:hypothetical protein
MYLDIHYISIWIELFLLANFSFFKFLSYVFKLLAMFYTLYHIFKQESIQVIHYIIYFNHVFDNTYFWKIFKYKKFFFLFWKFITIYNFWVNLKFFKFYEILENFEILRGDIGRGLIRHVIQILTCNVHYIIFIIYLVVNTVVLNIWSSTKHFISGQPHFGHNCFWGSCFMHFIIYLKRREYMVGVR